MVLLKIGVYARVETRGGGGGGGGAPPVYGHKRGYTDIVLEIEYSQLLLRSRPLGPTPSVRFRESNKGSK